MTPATGPFLFEACVGSVDDAVVAQQQGADRIEFCAALELDGLTPSLGAVEEARRLVRLPIMAIVRPRAGGFVHSDAEFRVMLRDVERFIGAGVDGLVFGVLTPDGEVDDKRCRELLARCAGRPTVFHRAFDAVRDPLAALDVLIELGVTRVLTSGGRPTAIAGAERIALLVEQSRGRIEILPGGGVSPDNVAQLLSRTGCRQAHASLRRRHGTESDAPATICPAAVAAMAARMKELNSDSAW